MKNLLILSTLFAFPTAFGNTVLDSLLVKIKTEQSQQTQISTDREAKFTKVKKDQLTVLKRLKLNLQFWS
jgi:hypothetical protein